MKRRATSRWPAITRELQRKYLARLWRRFGGKHGCITAIGDFLGISKQHALILLSHHNFRIMKKRGPYKRHFERTTKQQQSARMGIIAKPDNGQVSVKPTVKRSWFGTEVSL